MQRDPEQRRYDEETIEPVRPGFRDTAEPSPTATRKPRPERTGTLLAGGTLLALVIVAVFVFFALPSWVAPDRESTPAPMPAPVAEEPPAEPALSAEALAALRERAEGLLADLLTQQQRLETLSAPSWAGEDWPRYEGLAREGDDAYLAENLERAVEAYTEAFELGNALLTRADTLSEVALAAGRRALETGNAQLAIEQFDLVLSIDPDHPGARAGRARAEKLPEVLELVRRAADEAGQGRLEDAAQSYRAALGIDPNWPAARSGLAEVERRIEAARYEALMSRGMQALTDERYADAEQAFKAALAMRSDSDEARDGLLQAEQGAQLEHIALAEARGLAFERRELWAQAIAQYEQALETDRTLGFAREGLERARARADLDVKLVNLIDNPSLLLRDDVLESAAALLVDARETAAAARAETGEQPRLTAQIDRLDELIAIATTPVTVRLLSDEKTEVTLYRVGSLGTFAAREVELRPGHYTVVGSRDGFRDVRRTFSVMPGREIEPISVVCVDAI